VLLREFLEQAAHIRAAVGLVQHFAQPCGQFLRRQFGSPHSVTGVPDFLPARAICLSTLRKGTESGSKRSERSALPRSTAMTNWKRSFEPTETKSTAAISSSSCHRSDGTSSIAPSFRLVGR
jgi:hypothetical protein